MRAIWSQESSRKEVSMKAQAGLRNFFKQTQSGIISVFVILFLASQLIGCATRHQTTTRTTTTDSAGEVDASTTDRETTVTEKTTTSTEPQSDGGIFGGFFHLLGEVLAFPFRVIGSVFDAIF